MRSILPTLAAITLLDPIAAHAALSASDRRAQLMLHNTERCQVDPTAASMPAVTWNAALATVAQSWANGCALDHNANRTSAYAALGGAGYVGENIAWGTHGVFSPLVLAQLWANEKASWTYGPIDLATLGATGHYTQIVWANTTTIGCGFASCGANDFLVCNYNVGGNFIGSTPYAIGTGTTQACPEPVAVVGLALGAYALVGLRRRRRPLAATSTAPAAAVAAAAGSGTP